MEADVVRLGIVVFPNVQVQVDRDKAAKREAKRAARAARKAGLPAGELLPTEDGGTEHTVQGEMELKIPLIGKKLGKKTIAEFVENDRVKDILSEIDVDFAQGFGLHRPEPLSSLKEQIEHTLAQRRTGLVTVA